MKTAAVAVTDACAANARQAGAVSTSGTITAACREQINLAGLGDTSCGRSFAALSDGGAVSPTDISWWDCQDHFPEPTWPARGCRAQGLSGMASPWARPPHRGAKRP